MISQELKDWFHDFSQTAAVDMGEGGDDAECVAETCCTCIDVYEPRLAKELQAAFKEHGYKPVLAVLAKEVCTL